jgi:hypothetical protein
MTLTSGLIFRCIRTVKLVRCPHNGCFEQFYSVIDSNALPASLTVPASGAAPASLDKPFVRFNESFYSGAMPPKGLFDLFPYKLSRRVRANDERLRSGPVRPLCGHWAGKNHIRSEEEKRSHDPDWR